MSQGALRSPETAAATWPTSHPVVAALRPVRTASAVTRSARRTCVTTRPPVTAGSPATAGPPGQVRAHRPAHADDAVLVDQQRGDPALVGEPPHRTAAGEEQRLAPDLCPGHVRADHGDREQ